MGADETVFKVKGEEVAVGFVVPLKRICHVRCNSPLFFLVQTWCSGEAGALRLGMLHGVDCLSCCAGLMVGLVALGMMNLA